MARENKFTGSAPKKRKPEAKKADFKRSDFKKSDTRKREHSSNDEMRDDIVVGRNPVIELLSGKAPVDNIYIQQADSKSGAILKIMNMAREKGIVIKEVTKEKLDSLSPSIAHQGVIAVLAASSFASVEDILAKAGEKDLLIIICDEIEDPHNLGAIIRTADAVGADGVIIPSRRGVGLTAAVMKSSAGAAVHMPVAKVSNITATIKQLKDAGVWIFGADMNGEVYSNANFKGSVGLVVGSEGSGISRLVKENCDVIVSMPMNGKINSLNASVAAGVLMYEVVRQRAIK